ncbi:MAG: PorT family protein [Chloroflexia bacterium]|nr:PorT family protein [Chloroflexia bacterium]
MKNLAKLLMILLLIAITFQSVAQIDFGLRIGANFSKQLYKSNLKDIEGFEDFEELGDIGGMKMLPGGNIGFVLDIDINAPVSIETGMLLNTKGYRAKVDKYKESVYLVYVDVPINAKYTFDLDGPKFYLTAGPYLAFGVLGKGTSFEEDGDETIRNEWDYSWGKGILQS